MKTFEFDDTINAMQFCIMKTFEFDDTINAMQFSIMKTFEFDDTISAMQFCIDEKKSVAYSFWKLESVIQPFLPLQS